VTATEVVAIASAIAAAITVGISLFSLQTARAAERTAQSADRHERMPVLVCPSSNGVITVRNVGKGPALNICMALADQNLASRDASEISFDELTQTSWSGSVHLAPLEAGEKGAYEWSGGPVVGLSYTDALGLAYTTLASRYGTKVFDGNAMHRLKLSDLPYALVLEALD
jgi:hypothetical protein